MIVSVSRRLFVYLIICSLQILTIYSYGDPESMNYGSNLNETTAANFEDQIEENMDQQRVKRSIGDPTSIIDSFASKFVVFSNVFLLHIVL